MTAGVGFCVCWVGEREKEHEARSAYGGCVRVGGRGVCGGRVSGGGATPLQGVYVVVGTAGGRRWGWVETPVGWWE